MRFVRPGFVIHFSHTASARDLARLECELWKTKNGMWNADVLVYDALGMRFVRAGFVVHVCSTCGASDLACIECELLKKRQIGIWNPDLLLYDAAGMCFVHLSLTSAHAKRDLESMTYLPKRPTSSMSHPMPTWPATTRTTQRRTATTHPLCGSLSLTSCPEKH